MLYIFVSNISIVPCCYKDYNRVTMQFIYNINKEQNLIQVKCSDNISLDEVIKKMTKINNDPNLRPGMNTLVDISNAVFYFNLRDYNKAT